MTFGPANAQTAYLPNEFQIEGDQEFINQLISERESLTASIVNTKEIAQYEKRELLSGQQWFTSNVNGALVAKYGYRTTVDLVALNGGNIGAGVTALVLTSSTSPPAISNYVSPLPSGGAAIATDGVSLFLNDPDVYVRFTSSTNTITVTNNYGADLTYCIFEIEYLKQAL